MKLLIIDLLNPKGHNNFNNNILNLISNTGNKITIKKHKRRFYKGILKYIEQILLLIYFNLYALENRINNIIVLSYETMTFSLFNFYRIKYLAFNHYNVDDLNNSRFKRIIFNLRTNSNVTFVCMMEYIDDKFIYNFILL